MLNRPVKSATLLAVVSLLALGAATYWMISSVSPNVAAALITAVAAIVGVLLTQRANKEKEVAEAHRSAKVEVYRRFMNFVTAVTCSKGSKLEDRLGPDFEREFMEFTSELVVWGSPKVLQKFAAWRVAAQASKTPEPLLAVDDLLQAIREDLRNSNKGLKRGHLIGLYLREPAELERVSTSTSGLGMTVEDEAALFVGAYGPPEAEFSWENETSRPLLIGRSLVYKSENVRVLFIPDAPVGTQPPFSRWKLLGFQHAETNEPLDVSRVGELLAGRKLRK